MYFESLGEVWAMSGHGPYVWASYGLSFLVLAGLIYAPISRARQVKKDFAAEQRRERARSGQEAAGRAQSS